ncbi:MAG TPA: PAS domain-containing protein [Steroidobacteraceae bacterium]|nr:PAS domain-containing protein [Steroidobacteraceae bacterium]
MTADPRPPSADGPSSIAEVLHAAVAATLATVPEASLVHDAGGAILFANERAAALLRIPAARLLDRTLQDLSATPLPAPGEAASFAASLGEASRVATTVIRSRLALAGPPRYVCYLREAGPRRPQALQLAHLHDSNPAACFQKDLAGRYQFANAPCAEVLGMDPTGCIGKTDAELFPRATAEAIRRRDRQVIESGEPVVAAITLLSAGAPRRLLLHRFPVRDASGAVIGVASIASDVTAHEAVVDRLRMREGQLAIFFDASPWACYQKDLNGRYQIINATCAQIFAMDPVASIGKTDRELFPPDVAEQFISTDRAVLASGEVVVAEQAIDGPGGPRYFLGHKFPIRDGAGRMTSIAGTSVEITALRRAEQQLREAEARLRSIVQDMPVLLDAFDEAGTIVVWNSECERVTGYSAAEIVGNPRAMQILYPDPAYLDAMMREADELREQDYSRVYDLTAKDGTLRSIEWFNVGARLKIPGWLEWSVGIDVTERRRLEAALHEATIHEQRRLGYDLHDGLGQELTGLSLLASSLARRHAADNPELAAQLGTLAEIAAHAIITCKNIARGLAPIDEARQGLAEALRRLAEDFPDPNDEVAIEFVATGAAPIGIPLEACNHLYRIAQEALANAVRHSGASTVRIELRSGPDLLRLRISDDGRGFVEGHEAPGMGLRTIRHRALAIGGRLSIAPGRLGGTVVSCECPNRAPRPRAVTAAAGRPP